MRTATSVSSPSPMADTTGLSSPTISSSRTTRSLQARSTEPRSRWWRLASTTDGMSLIAAAVPFSLSDHVVAVHRYDPTIQYKAYIDYAYTNKYNKIITSQSQYNSYLSSYNSDCVPALKQCTAATGENTACEDADNTCYNDIEGPISELGDFDVYDVREPSNDPYPPSTYQTYLQQSSVQTAIGAKVKYQECPSAPYNKFANTGDDSRSFLATLGEVVTSGIRVALIAGDAGESRRLAAADAS